MARLHSIWLQGIAILIGTPLWASVPPPPVNQNIGFPDITMNDMGWETCLSCHGDPGSSTAPVNNGYLPDRHHLYLDTPIGRFSASPFPEASANGTHSCTTCHQIDWVVDASAPSGGYFAFARDPATPAFRDCLRCHKQIANIASVHHLAPKAQEAKCHLCHGNLINNPNGDHFIPDTGMVNVTPRPGHGDGETGETGRKRGGCRYCHEGGTDNLTGITVPVNARGNANNATHHGTGIGMGGTGSEHTCLLCHNWELEPGPLNGPYNIRGCERCHGISSLHNIQFDATGDGIVPGSEEPFYGHVGNNLDCRGCHGPNATFPHFPYPGDPDFDHMGEHSDCLGCHRSPGSLTIASASSRGPAFGPVVPYIAEASRKVVTAGYTTTITLSGSGFYTESDPIDVPSRILLLGNSGSAIELLPNQITPSHLEFTVPAALAPGSYAIKASKGTTGSNLINLTVLPRVTIDKTECNGNRITITGSGFGHYLEAQDSGTFLRLEPPGKQCSIVSWNDRKIIANCSPDGATSIVLKSIFGSASDAVSCSASGRPEWWSIWSWWSSWSWSRR